LIIGTHCGAAIAGAIGADRTPRAHHGAASSVASSIARPS
jgi:hypothetical protein